MVTIHHAGTDRSRAPEHVVMFPLKWLKDFGLLTKNDAKMNVEAESDLFGCVRTSINGAVSATEAVIF